MINYVCFNVSCDQRENQEGRNLCQNCGSKLLLNGQYFAIELLGKNPTEQSYKIIDQKRNKFYFLKQILEKNVPINPFSLNQYNLLPKTFKLWYEQDYYFLLQEWKEGVKLSKKLQQEGVFTLVEINSLLKDILSCLNIIHQHNWLHGDVKPSNLLWINNHYELLDLKVFSIYDDLSRVGDAEYSSPEQLQNKSQFSNDLYSLGVTVIHLLTGISPFGLWESFSQQWTWKEVLGLDISSCNEEELRIIHLLDRMIAQNPVDRPPSAGDCLRFLGYSPSLIPSVTPYRPFQGKCDLILTGHEGLFSNVNTLVFDPILPYLWSVSEDKTLRKWMVETNSDNDGEIILETETYLRSLAIHPQGKIIVCGDSEGNLYLINSLTLESHSQFIHQQSITHLAFNTKGDQLLTCSQDKTIKVWTIENDQTLNLKHTLTGHNLAVTHGLFSPNSQYIISSSQDKTIRLWNQETGKCLKVLQDHTWTVKTVAINPNSTIIASGGDDNAIKLWDIPSKKLIKTLSGHSWTITDLGFISDNLLISVSSDKTIKVWDIHTGETLLILKGHHNPIHTLAIHPHKPYQIATAGEDKGIYVWSLLINY